MKVFVDGIAFGRQVRGGGVSRVWQEYLQRLPSHGVDVKLLAPFHRTNVHLQELLKHVGTLEVVPDYFYWPSRYFERVTVRSALLKLHADDSVDVFQSTYFSTIYNCKCLKVIMIYDMIQEIVSTTHPGKWESFMMDMKRRAVENADWVIAISHNTKQDIVRFYPKIPEERISVIHCGPPVPSTREGPALADLARRRGLRVSPGGYFIYVGNREGYKNFGIILEMLDRGGRLEDGMFLCVGGENSKGLSRVVEERGYADTFVSVGNLDDDELAVLYQNAIALIYPSRYEGFGLPVLEAMANRCPVVCSNTSSLPEVAGEAAFYFDPGSAASLADAIQKLLKSDRQKVINAGLKNASRFSWDESTQLLVNLYESLR